MPFTIRSAEFLNFLIMKHFYSKAALASAMLLCCAGAAAKTYEASADWLQINKDGSAWELVTGEQTYYQAHPRYGYSSSGSGDDTRGDGQGLFVDEVVQLSAGDTYQLRAAVTSSDYNHDMAFKFAYTLDDENYTTIGTSDQICYNPRNQTTPVFADKPSATSYIEFKVTQSGTYRFGVVSRGGMNRDVSYFMVKSITADLKVDYPLKVTGMSATRPDGPELKATISWTWPTKTDGGADLSAVCGKLYRQTSSSFSASEAHLVADITDGVPGEQISVVDNDVPAAGKYYYFLQTYLGDGVNPTPQSTQSNWIGEDSKCLNLVANQAKLEPIDNGFRISFTKRIEGYNGGWIDSERAFIKITRQKDNDEPIVVTETYQGDSPYVDAEVDGPGKYTYRLFVVYNGVESAECKVGPMFGGGSMALPFSEDFSQTSSLDSFTVISTNSSYKWERNYSGYLQFKTSSYSSSKSNVMTPPLKLEAGHTYRISALSWVDEDEDDDDWYGYGGWTEPVPQDLVITAGSSASFDAQAQIAKVNVNKGESEKMTVEAFFTPETSGNYNIGFQAQFMNYNRIFLDDICVEESISLPADVADFSVVPDAAGAKSATVSFTIPDKTNSGAPLAELSSVTVSRLADGEDAAPVVVKTYEGEECVPGSAVSFVDEVPVENNYTYSVVAKLGDNESNVVESQKMWVGYDYPKNVSGFTISLGTDERGAAVLSWTELSGNVAVHGGYVDMENLKYRIYRITGKDSEGEKVFVGESSVTSYVDEASLDLPWNVYRYAVSAVNGEMESEPTVGYSTKVLGDCVELPYAPALDDEAFTDSWESRGFMVSEEKAAFSCYNKGTDYAAGSYYTTLPPFYTQDIENPMLELDMTLSCDNEEFEEAFDVYAVKVGELKESTGEETSHNADAEESTEAAEAEPILIKHITVNAPVETPAETNVVVNLPEPGKYRLKLELASTDNRGVNIHTLSLKHSAEAGLQNVADASASYLGSDGQLRFAEAMKRVEVYAANGIVVATATNAQQIDLTNLASGLYIVKAENAKGQTKTFKLLTTR